jgi:nicotinamidase-related amidase
MPKALLIVDVQQALCAGADAAHDIGAVVARINLLSTRARAAGMTVIFVQHEEERSRLEFGTQGWELYEELTVEPSDLRVMKSMGNSFRDTDLESLLRARAVDGLVICGLQSDHCVDATVRGAHALGYPVTLVSDAHSTVGSHGHSAADLIGQHNDRLAQLGRVELKLAADVDIP